MAETLLSFAVEKLWDLLVRESDRFQELEEQFDELKSDLNMLRCFLEDADAKKHTSAMVRNTVQEIKEIAYDAEDIIESFLLKEKLGKMSGIKNSMGTFSCVVSRRMRLSFKLKAIRERISKVIRDMQSLGVQQVIVNEGYTQSLQERQREMRQTFSHHKESVLVGLEKTVNKLVDYLKEEDGSQVVSITGMGGIGKTTLARQVFNHETIQRHFERLAWVCVSQQFTREYVWQTILRKLRPESKVLEMTKDELQEKLFQLLETQKALIVIDDIWREEDWDIIEPMFPRKKGWKVILTSRNEGVALHADPTCFTFKADCLTLEESWTLFRRIAYPSNNSSEYKVDEEMEELGKQMIKHCGGLPLAVKVLGGLLAAQYTLHEWKRIYENIKSHIVGGTSFDAKSMSSVYHVLHLSFEELPIYLKQCFLYLAHFPEDYTIDVGELSYYWAAEGIPRPRYFDGATIREVADAYMEELVKRNMVISEREIRTLKFETCHLHDMMREVCVLKAEEENFLQILDASTITSTANSQSPRKSRRLVIQSVDGSIHMKRCIINPKLRSFMRTGKFEWFSPLGSEPSCLPFTRLMRVLDLSGVHFEKGKLSSNIGKLIHLRYLSLHHAHVTHLPSSIQNLTLLLYLNIDVIVMDRSQVYMSDFFKELQELRYLALPTVLQDETKLELGHLINLERLGNFSTKHSSVTDLHSMTRLRGLSVINNGEDCTLETLSSSLLQLKHLENLNLR